ncbi:MAG: DUF1579 domain-containing protein [Planctomycetota bacterium]|nr:MAG: DUF1579 domain-containing protein [Planctomycetota bacterium]
MSNAPGARTAPACGLQTPRCDAKATALPCRGRQAAPRRHFLTWRTAMTERRFAWFTTIAGCAALVGCAPPKMTMDDMRAMVPQRPAELDYLNAFVGKWSFEGEVVSDMFEEPFKMTGESEMHWSGDMWYLISDGVWRMGDMDEMKGHEVWCYDAKARKFRSVWVDSMGSFGVGEGSYDAATRTWRTQATSHGPMGKSTMKGTIKIIDEDTMEWSAAEYNGWMKTMEFTGVSRRIK